MIVTEYVTNLLLFLQFVCLFFSFLISSCNLRDGAPFPQGKLLFMINRKSIGSTNYSLEHNRWSLKKKKKEKQNKLLTNKQDTQFFYFFILLSRLMLGEKNCFVIEELVMVEKLHWSLVTTCVYSS